MTERDIPTLLDHVVIAGPDLDEVIEWFAQHTGVRAAPGGAHPTGTANALVALTINGTRVPHYLELIGPNPERDDPAVPATFGISSLTEPKVAAYAVHPDDIDQTVADARARGLDLGEVSDLSRLTPDGTLLEWRLTRGDNHPLDQPFLIDWGSTAQPGLGDLPTIELVSFVRVEPDPTELTDRLALSGLGAGVAAVVAGDASGYRLRLRRDDGRIVELT